MGSTSTTREFGWAVAQRLQKSKLAPLVNSVAKLETPAGVWRDFTPTADRIEDISTDLSGGGAIDGAVDLLRKHGVVVIHGLHDRARIEATRAEMDILIDLARDAKLSGDSSGTVTGGLWQINMAVLKTYNALASHPTAVITFRDGDIDDKDAGMIDVFGIDRLAKANGLTELTTLLDTPAFETIASIVRGEKAYTQRVFNLYHNEGVVSTWGAHIDSLEPAYKAFTYLTDVTSTDDGPYCYVPGTHRRPDLLRKAGLVQKAHGQMELIYPDLEAKGIKMIAPAGTVIISSQAGAHWGYPQSPSGKRTVVVVNHR